RPSSEITSDLARSTARNPVKGPALSRTTRLGCRHKSAPELLSDPTLSSGRQRFAGQVLREREIPGGQSFVREFLWGTVMTNRAALPSPPASAAASRPPEISRSPDRMQNCP